MGIDPEPVQAMPAYRLSATIQTLDEKQNKILPILITANMAVFLEDTLPDTLCVPKLTAKPWLQSSAVGSCASKYMEHTSCNQQGSSPVTMRKHSSVKGHG